MTVASLDLDGRVTVAIVPRERFSFAIESLRSVLQNTPHPIPIVYVDGRSPGYVREFVESKALSERFLHLRFERYLSPNEARNTALKHVDTEFVVFVDNDLIVYPGWLERLVQCADETGASLVGPIYLEGGPCDSRVHMAGGLARIESDGGNRYCVERHFHRKGRLSEISGSLERTAVELVEFHCILARMQIFRSLGYLDNRLLSLHEHTDFCLNVRAGGGTIVLEPRSQVRYSFEGGIRASDLPYVALRWSDDWNASTNSAFKQKWALCEADPSIGWSLSFGRSHRRLLLRQYLPKWLRHFGFTPRALTWLLDKLSEAVGRARYQRSEGESSEVMSPGDHGAVTVLRNAVTA